MAEATKTKRKPAQKAKNKKAGGAFGGLSDELVLELFREMLLYRRFEEKVEEAYAIGKIGGFCHLHIGQEAGAAGCIRPLRSDDYVITAYRALTQALAKGVGPNEIMAELYGRADGVAGGRGGSMHIMDVSKGFMGGHGIVGGQIPLASGLGWAIKYRGEDRVCVCFMGDAATNQGAFLEALNMSAIWNLPVIYVVENNDYGMGTKFSRVSRTEVSERASAYGIPSHIVDGQDVIATYNAFSELAETTRSGGGPQYVDLQTYRFKGHSMSDPVSGTYRSKKEVDAAVAERDPILILRTKLEAAGLMTPDSLAAVDAEVKKICEEAIEFAEASPVPDPSTLYDNVYAEINENGRLFFDADHGGPSRG